MELCNPRLLNDACENECHIEVCLIGMDFCFWILINEVNSRTFQLNMHKVSSTYSSDTSVVRAFTVAESSYTRDSLFTKWKGVG